MLLFIGYTKNVFIYLFKNSIKAYLQDKVVRFIFAFFVAWAFSILLNDIPFFVNLIRQTNTHILLQNILVNSAKFFLNILGFETYSESKFLQIIGTAGVRFEYGCLGIRHVVIFSTFILFYFGKFFRKLFYVVLGSFILELSNAVRAFIICIGQYYSETNTTLVHDIASPIFMYPVILLLWLIWIKSRKKQK